MDMAIQQVAGAPDGNSSMPALLAYRFLTEEDRTRVRAIHRPANRMAVRSFFRTDSTASMITMAIRNMVRNKRERVFFIYYILLIHLGGVYVIFKKEAVDPLGDPGLPAVDNCHRSGL